MVKVNSAPINILMRMVKDTDFIIMGACENSVPSLAEKCDSN